MDVLSTSVQDELDDKDKDYFSVPHKEWCDLLSIMEGKYNRKRAASQIKILSASKAEPDNSYSNTRPRVTQKNKERTGYMPSRKRQGKNNPKHKGFQCYCVLRKKAEMPERKYKLHISENCFGRGSDQESIK